MKATARAHPIQGLLKSHGLRDAELNIPYHDSISVCTAPSATRTTVEFGYEEDSCLVNGVEIDDEGTERVETVVDCVRSFSGIDTCARVESENTFESNIGLGASASAFAALALAAATATDLRLSREELSALARRGAPSAPRSVTGRFSHLRTNGPAENCVAERISDAFSEDIRIIVGVVSQHKQTSRAHTETPQSHLFGGRLRYIHGAIAELRKAIQDGNFESTFALAEYDSLQLLAVTMTGPKSWVYWQPKTLELLTLARRLRKRDIPVFFSADTGATAYLNTTAEYATEVANEVEALGVESRIWRIGGRAEIVDSHLF